MTAPEERYHPAQRRRVNSSFVTTCFAPSRTATSPHRVFGWLRCCCPPSKLRRDRFCAMPSPVRPFKNRPRGGGLLGPSGQPVPVPGPRPGGKQNSLGADRRCVWYPGKAPPGEPRHFGSLDGIQEPSRSMRRSRSASVRSRVIGASDSAGASPRAARSRSMMAAARPGDAPGPFAC